MTQQSTKQKLGKQPKKEKQMNKEINQEIQAVEAEIQQKVYTRGDTVEFNGMTTRVVEVIEKGRLHLKNVNPPNNSMIVLTSEIEKALEKENAPDLMVREDKRFSL